MTSQSSHRAIWYAVGSGACAALGSVLTKLAVADTRQNPLCRWLTVMARTAEISDASSLPCETTDPLFVTIRAVCFGAQTIVGVAMWWLFSRALQQSPSSVYVTVLNTACNFMLTALCGSLLFGEALTTRWSMGASLILFGTVLVHHGSTTRKQSSNNQGVGKTKQS